MIYYPTEEEVKAKLAKLREGQVLQPQVEELRPATIPARLQSLEERLSKSETSNRGTFKEFHERLVRLEALLGF